MNATHLLWLLFNNKFPWKIPSLVVSANDWALDCGGLLKQCKSDRGTDPGSSVNEGDEFSALDENN